MVLSKVLVDVYHVLTQIVDGRLVLHVLGNARRIVDGKVFGLVYEGLVYHFLFVLLRIVLVVDVVYVALLALLHHQVGLPRIVVLPPGVQVVAVHDHGLLVLLRFLSLGSVIEERRCSHVCFFVLSSSQRIEVVLILDGLEVLFIVVLKLFCVQVLIVGRRRPVLVGQDDIVLVRLSHLDRHFLFRILVIRSAQDEFALVFVAQLKHAVAFGFLQISLVVSCTIAIDLNFNLLQTGLRR